MAAKVIVITGPTATGKTALGVELALQFGGQVVSADSMQIYRGMDVGTAKVTPDEMRGVVHHMIDVADPGENYSVARYVEQAAACCDDIISRDLVPIIVGGTGLYIDSLISGRDFADNSGGSSMRAELEAEFDRVGGEAMLKILGQFDPLRAAKLDPGNRRRIIRAIEVYRLTGKTITEHDEETQKLPPRYDAAVIALNFADRQTLYDRIDRRVDIMVENGLLQEVSGLLKNGLSKDSTALQAIGYKEAVAALEGKWDEARAVELIKQGSRRYAKRQLTWLRRNPEVFWINWEKSPDMELGRRLSTEFLHSRGL